MENDIKNEITYKLLEENELSGISRLIKSMKKSSTEVLKLRNNSIDYYHWIYFKNPAGKAIIASAWHNGILVSTFAMAPKKVKMGGKELLLGKTMDMFTDPDYQGLGIISNLSKLVFEESTNRGLAGWYVTPSGNSYPIFKNKWEYIESFEIFYRYRIINICRLAETIIMSRFKKQLFKFAAVLAQPFFSIKKDSIAKYEITSVNSFSEEFDELWNSVADDYDNILIRDATYLNWRFTENPDKYHVHVSRQENKINGYIVTKNTIRKGVKTAEIADILFNKNKPEIGISLIQFAQVESLKSGCAIYEAWDFSDSVLSSTYQQSGLTKNRAIVKFLLSPEVKREDFYDKSKWYLTQSDGNDI